MMKSILVTLIASIMYCSEIVPGVYPMGAPEINCLYSAMHERNGLEICIESRGAMSILKGGKKYYGEYKKDILERYIKEDNGRMVWIVWGKLFDDAEIINQIEDMVRARGFKCCVYERACSSNTIIEKIRFENGAQQVDAAEPSTHAVPPSKPSGSAR